ncbi:MAG: hypothetical protein IJT78_00455 [Oscillospiraceae bacterium]|nr:hypothetical protein [Oscillospiraceae bacterium]
MSGGMIRPWLLGVAAAVLIITAAYAVTPGGKPRAAIRFCAGVLLIWMLLRPLSGWNADWFGESFSAASRSIDQQIEQYREENMKRMEEVIADKTEAYIADKGAQWGITCHPQVETQRRDGVAYPYRVVMDVPMHRGLSAYLTEQLDIPPERQIWQEG